MNRVFLTGFMGSGKSTVGRILEGKTGWSFEDLDPEQVPNQICGRILEVTP